MVLLLGSDREPGDGGGPLGVLNRLGGRLNAALDWGAGAVKPSYLGKNFAG